MQVDRIRRESTWPVIIFCLGVVAVPKAGVLLGGQVPLQSALLVGQTAALAGWALALRRVGRERPRTAITMMGLGLVIWSLHVAILASSGGIGGARHIARLGYNIFSLSALGVAYWVASFSESRMLILRRWLCGVYYGLLGYAAAQMVFGPERVAVRYLTANYEDVFEEVLKKSNVVHRVEGEVAKLFGTYQNGNLFALGLLLVGPLAFAFERRRWLRMAALGWLHVVILFTASTSGYVGLIVLDLLYCLADRRARRWVPAVLPIVLLVAPIFVAVGCSGDQCVATELLDAKLVNRDLTTNLRWDKAGDWFDRVSLEPWRLLFGEMSDAQAGQIFEVLPLSLAQNFGLAVAVLFYVVVFRVLWLRKSERWNYGLIAYLVASIGSGGYWLTPIAYLVGLSVGVAHWMSPLPLWRGQDVQPLSPQVDGTWISLGGTGRL
jgi:hypothetical protein